MVAGDNLIGQWRAQLELANSKRVVDQTEDLDRLKQIEALNRQADQAVRNLLEAADQVATLVNARRLQQELQQRYDQSLERIDGGQIQTERLRADWQQLWTGCPFVPSGVKQGNEWLDDFVSWREHRLTLERVASEFTSAVLLRDESFQELTRLWPKDNVLIDSVDQARRQFDLWRSASAAQDAQSRIIAELTATLSAAETQSKLLENERTASEQQLDDLLRRLGLPSHWPKHEVLSRLDVLGRVRAEVGRHRALLSRSELISDQIEQFARAVQEIGAKIVPADDTLCGLSPSSVDGTPERTVQRWLDVVVRSEEIERQRHQLAASIAHAASVARSAAKPARPICPNPGAVSYNRRR